MNPQIVEDLSTIRTRTETFDALTGLRGVAACWVAAFHLSPLYTTLWPQISALDWLFLRGSLAVPMFFLLSGYVLTHNYWGKFQTFTFQAYKDYLWLRFTRIYPAYLVALLVMVLLVGVAAVFHVPFSRTSYPPGVLPLELLMLHTWGSLTGVGWNYPSWSVSSEWFAYVFAFPGAIWLAKRIRSPGLLLAGIGLLLAAESWRFVQPHKYQNFGYAPLMTSILFLAGSLGWHFRERFAWKRWRHLDSISVMGAVLSLWFAPNLPPIVFEMAMLVSFIGLIIGLSERRGIFVKFFSFPFMIWLGEISYPLYVTHGVVHRALKPLYDHLAVAGQPAIFRALLLLLHIGAVIGAAAILHYAVERPGRAWLRNIYFERRKAGDGGRS